MLKQFILKYAPELFLNFFVRIKKKNRRNTLLKQKERKKIITKHQLIDDLRKIGLNSGDSVLVHCSMSKIGYVQDGAKTIIEALSETIGENGTLLFPSFPAKGRNKDHLEQNLRFDCKNTPSRMGVVTEYFRTSNGVFRSLHPTDSVCAKGPLAEYYTNSHLGQLTPYNEFSPFRKLCDKSGKILMLGTTLNGACTNLHTLEDAVDFKFPVYDKKLYKVTIVDSEGHLIEVQTKVHNPEYSAKRNCDALKPIFEKENILVNGLIGEAKSMMIDANAMLETMIKYYNEKGVTMYTPHGS
ncbi:MAG: AAC(3) family N-acetyltransferase [Bacteroidota bacterium]